MILVIWWLRRVFIVEKKRKQIYEYYVSQYKLNKKVNLTQNCRYDYVNNILEIQSFKFMFFDFFCWGLNIFNVKSLIFDHCF